MGDYISKETSKGVGELGEMKVRRNNDGPIERENDYDDNGDND